MKSIHTLLLLLAALAVGARAAEPALLTPYQLVSKKRVGRTVMEYTFKARLRGGDQPLRNVRATAVSNSPATEVIDGVVTFGDVAAGATVLSQDTFTVRQDRRRGNFGPASLRWQVQYDPPAGFTLSAQLIPMPEALRVGLVEPQPLVHQLTLLGMKDPKHLSNQPLHARISQTVRPDPTGLRLQPALDGRRLASDRGILRDFLEQQVRGLKPGRYTLVTTLTVEETGETVRDEVTIEVAEGAESLPEFKQLYFIPYALPAGQVTETEIQLEIANVRRGAVESVRAYTPDGRYEVTLVNDSPQAGGLLYRGRLAIDATSMQPDQCLTFEAEVMVQGRSHTTPPARLYVTGLPTNASPGHRGSFSGVLVRDAEGKDHPADKLYVTVVAGTSEARVREIARSIGAEVYENEGWGDYIFRLLTPARSYRELKDVAERLKALPEVEDAYPSTILWHASGLTAPIPNDPFVAEQSQLRTRLPNPSRA
ncbi:MAG TPA: hypothetical protein ENJ31_13180 [Anaerolineae bacterium]|nr:hypothetical protein [Anaerolineae bacterium]